MSAGASLQPGWVMHNQRRHTADSGLLTRATRALPELETDYFQLDERRLADLLNTAAALSRLLTYFDTKNTPHHSANKLDETGAWEAFFRHDVSFLLAEIAAATSAPQETKAVVSQGQFHHAVAASISQSHLYHRLRSRQAEQPSFRQDADGVERAHT